MVCTGHGHVGGGRRRTRKPKHCGFSSSCRCLPLVLLLLLAAAPSTAFTGQPSEEGKIGRHRRAELVGTNSSRRHSGGSSNNNDDLHHPVGDPGQAGGTAAVVAGTGHVSQHGRSMQAVAVAPQHHRRVDVPLVTGCGRGGTHATAAVLQELGVAAVHEKFRIGAISVSWLYGAPVRPQEEFIDNDGLLSKGRFPFEFRTHAEARLQRLRSFSPVVLLVRHPLDVIGSVRRCFCAVGLRNGTKNSAIADDRSWSFIERKVNVTRFLPAIKNWAELPLDSMRRAMVYWVGWNSIVEEAHALHLAGYDGEGGDASGGAPRGDARWRRQDRLRRVRSSANHTVRLEDPFLPHRLTRLLNLSQAVQDKAARLHMHNTDAGKSAVDDATRAATRASWPELHAADHALGQRIWAMAQRYGYETEHPTRLSDFLQRL